MTECKTTRHIKGIAENTDDVLKVAAAHALAMTMDIQSHGATPVMVDCLHDVLLVIFNESKASLDEHVQACLPECDICGALRGRLSG